MSSEYSQNGFPLDTPKNFEDLYILDDGTQICASQIQFDNDDPPVDLTTEKIPFVKYIVDETDNNVTQDVDCVETVNYNIVGSPIRDYSNNNGNHCNNFVDELPFKLVCNNTTGFEHQFAKYLESKNKTYNTHSSVVNNNQFPASLIKDKFKKCDDYKEVCYTREDILNMFKDSPVKSLPFEYTDRKHIRKTDPSRIHKSFKPKVPYIDMNGVIIGGTENQPCYICSKNVEYAEKLYLFDNKDQKLHRTQKKMESEIKIICEACLEENFKPCHMKSANQCLAADEFLVIRNNQQFIFKKVKEFNLKSEVSLSNNDVKDNEFVKVEIGSDGEIETKPIENFIDDIVLVEDVKDSSSDVEIIEELDTIIDNLDEADEEVKFFLGKNQDEELLLEELKCRFVI